MSDFPNRGFYRGDLEAALRDFGIAVVPNAEQSLTVSITVEEFIKDAVESPRMTNEIAKSQGFTGNSCTKCNSMRVVVTGHCETCQDCGETSSCG